MGMRNAFKPRKCRNKPLQVTVRNGCRRCTGYHSGWSERSEVGTALRPLTHHAFKRQCDARSCCGYLAQAGSNGSISPHDRLARDDIFRPPRRFAFSALWVGTHIKNVDACDVECLAYVFVVVAPQRRLVHGESAPQTGKRVGASLLLHRNRDGGELLRRGRAAAAKHARDRCCCGAIASSRLLRGKYPRTMTFLVCGLRFASFMISALTRARVSAGNPPDSTPLATGSKSDASSASGALCHGA